MSEQENIITIKSALGKDRRLIVMPVRDPKMNWFLGVPRLSEEDKRKLTFWTEPSSKLVITNNYTFNLGIEVDKANWEWVQHVEQIAPSFEAAQKSKATWYVDNEMEELRKAMSKEDKFIKALNLVKDDSEDMLPGRARLMGYEMEGDSPMAIRKFLYKMAKDKNTIDKLINAYESNTLAKQLVYFKALDKGLISESNGALVYGAQVLGVGDESAMSFLFDPANSSIIDQMKSELSESKVSKQNVKKRSTKPV